MQQWWTDERIDAVLTKEYVRNSIDAGAKYRLNEVIFEDLSDATYQDWILERSRRLFLILLEIGCPVHIFYLIDLAQDDSALPLQEEDLSSFRLPQSRSGIATSRLFLQTQLKYLLRTLREGEHIDYAPSATVPINAVDQKVPAGYQGIQNRVLVPITGARVFLRTKQRATPERSQHEILSDIAALRSNSHYHMVKVYCSYSHRGIVYTLLQTAASVSLKTCLEDISKSSKTMSKEERDFRLLQWPRCLANAIAWLHEDGIAHGRISPTHILVDDSFQVLLGELECHRVVETLSSSGGRDRYQYSAPELCRREMVVRQTGSPVVPGEGGVPFLRSKSIAQSWRSSRAVPSLSRSDSFFSEHQTSPIDSLTSVSPLSGPALISHNATRALSISFTSSTSSDDLAGRASSRSSLRRHPTQDPRATLVSAFRIAKVDLQPADMFSVSAVFMEILTVLCSETNSTFTRHRTSTSRSASRGAGAIDSSFHANLHTLTSWCGKLDKKADKKARKGGHLFRAVGPMLAIAQQGLARNATQRPGARQVSSALQDVLVNEVGAKGLHCCT